MVLDARSCRKSSYSRVLPLFLQNVLVHVLEEVLEPAAHVEAGKPTQGNRMSAPRLARPRDLRTHEPARFSFA